MTKKIILKTLLLLFIASCKSPSPDRNEFIRNQIVALNQTINAENGLLNNKLLKIDSGFQSIRDSTQLIYDVITDLNYQLQEFPIHNSEINVNDFMITEGNARKLQNIINEYCRFMSRPGFKVWDIAKNAKTEEMINTNDYIPFEEYHFKETNVIEAEIILSHLLNEVLNVESRYYAFKLRNEVCN